MGDPSTYQTRNNRLMYYETFDISDPQTPALLERVYYEYSEDVQAGRQGSPTTIVWETPQPSGPAAFRAIDLQYNNSGELWLAIRRHWSGDEGCEEVIDGITEFRGSGRARRLVRQRDPACPYLVAADTTRWTDYDGDEAYADYVMTLDPQTGVASPVQTAAYLPGVGQMDMQTGWVSYLHGDQIGTLRAVSGSVFAGTPPERVTRRLVYTAFGEKVYDEGSGSALPPEDTRYQYAGAWGYESDAAQGLPFLHVGYRYYDPSTGRFLQRDPIGIRGGLNTYEYVASNPTLAADPDGRLLPLLVIGGAAAIVLIIEDVVEAPGSGDLPAGMRQRRQQNDCDNISEATMFVGMVCEGPAALMGAGNFLRNVCNWTLPRIAQIGKWAWPHIKAAGMFAGGKLARGAKWSWPYIKRGAKWVGGAAATGAAWDMLKELWDWYWNPQRVRHQT